MILLDVGAGTDYVTRQLASAFPDADEVIGFHLSVVPESPEKTRAVYVQGDIMDPTSISGPIDFLFGRMLVYGIRDWPAYIARA